MTANTPFIVTIPAGAFTDDQNDPLTCTPSVRLPSDWLMLDADTGTFSGTPTPVTEQTLTSYTYTVSDGTTSTNSMIGITVNAAPTLPEP